MQYNYAIYFQLIPIGIEISLMGYRNKTVIDYIKFIQLESHESHWLFKAIFVQITIYVSLFFTMLVMCGILIKEQMPKKLVRQKIRFNNF